MSNKILFIDNGKHPEDAFNAKLTFWLPVDSPFGNFQLKLMKLIVRVDEVNRNLIESDKYWKLFVDKRNLFLINVYDKHIFANEKVIYFMRKVADEIIALVYYLMCFEKSNKYSEQIEIDCIGGLLKKSNTEAAEYFADHISMLQQLNEISNAFKHSFVNSDINVVGKDEPCVQALDLKYNKIQSGDKFYSISVKSIVENFNLFYGYGIKWLKNFSGRNMKKEYKNI